MDVRHLCVSRRPLATDAKRGWRSGVRERLVADLRLAPVIPVDAAVDKSVQTGLGNSYPVDSDYPKDAPY